MTDEAARNQPKPLSYEQQLQLTELKSLEEDFIRACRKIGQGRELALAVINMQQAGFWAQTHVIGGGK